jgi:hypothetical protein
MAGTLKKVIFVRPWQDYVVGEVIEPNGTRRDWLISNGYCELLPDKPRGVRNAGKVVEQAKGSLFTR